MRSTRDDKTLSPGVQTICLNRGTNYDEKFRDHWTRWVHFSPWPSLNGSPQSFVISRPLSASPHIPSRSPGPSNGPHTSPSPMISICSSLYLHLRDPVSFSFFFFSLFSLFSLSRHNNNFSFLLQHKNTPSYDWLLKSSTSPTRGETPGQDNPYLYPCIDHDMYQPDMSVHHKRASASSTIIDYYCYYYRFIQIIIIFIRSTFIGRRVYQRGALLALALRNLAYTSCDVDDIRFTADSDAPYPHGRS